MGVRDLDKHILFYCYPMFRRAKCPKIPKNPPKWGRFGLKWRARAGRHFFSGLRAHDVRGPLGTRSQGSHQRRAHLAPKRPRNRPQKSKIGPKNHFFLRYLALAPPRSLRDRVFIAYSRSPRAYRSNGVSHSPNPVREPPSKWAKIWAYFSVFGPYFSVFGL